MNIKEKIPTPHISAKSDQIAKIVIMPGDPLRAKYIANNFLQDCIEISNVRNMLMFTGKYQGQRITIAASGMGMPSIGIYSYELYKFYDVDCIIRIGSGGSYQADIKVYDIINATKAYSESTFAKYAANINENQIAAVGSISNIINKVAANKKINLKSGLVHSTDIFYRAHEANENNAFLKKCLAAEMEAFALFANATYLQKNAACLLTISDSFITGESISSTLRETSFNKMIVLALEAAIAYYQEKR